MGGEAEVLGGGEERAKEGAGEQREPGKPRIPIPSPAFRSVRVETVFVLAKAGEPLDSLDISRPLALWEQAPGIAAGGKGPAQR